MAGETEVGTPPQRRLWPRRAIGVGMAVPLIVAYVAVILLYGRSTQPDQPLADIPDEEAVGKTLIGLDFTGLSTADSAMSIEVSVFPSADLLDRGGYLKQKLEVLIVSVDAAPDETSRAVPFEGRSLTFPAGTALLVNEIKLRPSGPRQNYPFDRYEGFLGAAATTRAGDKQEEVPSLLVLGGVAPGWTVETVRKVEHPDEDVELGSNGLQFQVSRAGSTMAIALLILAAMIIMILCAAYVATSVLRKRRRIEATMASWFAAMLFAVIPLRLNMPGAPAMGVWMDFLVVLWVEVGLMIALGVFIYSWLSYTPKPPYAPDEPEPAPAGDPPGGR